MTIGWLIFWVVWVACGVLNYGSNFAYFQENWPELAKEHRREDTRFSWFMAVVGPIGTLILLLEGDLLQYGWRLH